jgi:DNA helicase II / ATP-dependent DNA helicase PcrA
LEFDYVFFLGCTTSFWEKKKKPNGGFSFPDTLFSSSAKGNDTEELRRLFYVALTRAKGHLYISYPNYTNEGKQQEPTMFIAEIEEEHQLNRLTICTGEQEKLQFSLLPFQQRLAPEVQHLDEELVQRVLNSFTMNVSALNSYLRCPLNFYYQTLIRIPSPKNESTEFGSAVHYALEQLFRKMRANGDFADVDDLLNDFTWYMKRHRESFTKEQFQRRMEYGTEILKNYYNTYYTKWNKVVTIEMNIKNLLLDGVPLRGKLDKIEFNGKEAFVIDYKTGDPDNASDKLKRPSDKNPNGGDYWRQAIFYKILIDLYPKQWMVNTIEFDFVEPDKKKKYRKEKIVVSDIDVDIVKQQVKTVWTKIQEKDFYTGCGKEDCHWCNFAKTNKLAISLHELKEEEEVVRGLEG